MNLIYVYDFETNGFPLWNKPSSHPDQPHLVQLAAVMVDADTRKTVQSIDLIARPDGWDIPDEVAEIHGITTEHAFEVGIDESIIAYLLSSFDQIASCRIGHNQPFDARIQRIALKRFHNEEMAETWKAGESYCTQSKSTPIVKCPPSAKMLAAGRKGNKTASLGEAFFHFMGKPMEDAHTAMGDVLATMRVYWAIKDMEDRDLTKRLSEPTEAAPEGSGGDGVGFL